MTEGVKKAVILAAGLGSRLGGEAPKPLIEVDGRPLLHRGLTLLADAGVREAVLVVGHRAEEIHASVGDRFAGVELRYVLSERYAETNNAYSLWLARHELDQDVLLLEADVAFDSALPGALDAVGGDAVCAVAAWTATMSGTVVELNKHGRVVRMLLAAGRGPMDLHGMFKTVNINLLRGEFLRRTFLPALDAFIASGGENSYYEEVLANLVDGGRAQVGSFDCGGLPWYEIDDATDLIAARFLFGSPDERLEVLRGLHGGFWRYDFVDHCLLYNLYFPTEPMLAELSEQFRDCLRHYPVGHRTLQELLSPVVGHGPQRLVVANGASELIKILGRTLGRVALAVPGFNEYEAVFAEEDIERIELCEPDYTLDARDFARCAAAAKVDAVIITTPNNPTSRALPRDDVLLLSMLLNESRITLIVDESFIEFCDEDPSVNADLDAHSNLVIVKSMSKVYGVGGLRLGYLVTADLALAGRVRAQLPIWNVNGFAEAFLRILPRYLDAFRSSCARVRRDRDALAAGLASIPGLTVFPADANFVMVRLPDGCDGPETVRALFTSHGILVKDCAGKSMADGARFLRIACRTPEENERFVAALDQVLAAVATSEAEAVLA